jgi:hypothetical protein
MNALTCAEVQEQLDLLAADECDPPTRAAIEAHVRQCSTCAAGYAESQRVQGLLGLYWNQSGVDRLRQRVEQETRPTRRLRLFTPYVHRTLAAAAGILIVVGLIWWLPQWHTNPLAFEPQLALLVRGDQQSFKVDAQSQARTIEKGVELVMPLTAPSGVALKHDLLKAGRDGKIPPPPAISLDLALVNNGDRPTTVRIGDAEPTLSLEVHGDGVVRLPASDAATPSFLEPVALQLAPGERHIVHIDRLIDGSPGRLEYIYLTEPGEYALTARLRANADGQVITVTSGPVRIRVAK